MGRIKSVLESPILANVVGSLTLVATIIFGYLTLHPSGVAATPATDKAAAAIAQPHAPMALPIPFLIFAGAIGIGLLLPSWVALFKSAQATGPQPTQPIRPTRRVTLPAGVDLGPPRGAPERPATVSSVPALITAPEPEPDHSLIDVSPFELSAFFDQHLTPQAEKLLEPYLGKRLRLAATVVDIDVNRGGGRVYVYATIPDPGDPHWTGMHVHLYFDQNWKSRLLILKRGNPITAVGYIERAASRTITLENCGLD